MEFTYADGEKGLAVDQKKLEEEIRKILEEEKSGSITATVEEVDYESTMEELSQHMGALGTFSNVCTNNANSEHNMRLAMQKMDQNVIGPGETYSFNGATGDTTTAEGGWVQSGGWMGGELVPMYGGGICQASTVLYNCALLSGLEIVERYCHMQPSSYADPGLDATVDYGNPRCQGQKHDGLPDLYCLQDGWDDPDDDHVRLYFHRI